MPVEEKQARVEEVLSQLGLMHIADSPIGDGNRRGISGGEVRRVSIGLELVAKPHILLLVSSFDSSSRSSSSTDSTCFPRTNPLLDSTRYQQPRSSPFFGISPTIPSIPRLCEFAFRSSFCLEPSRRLAADSNLAFRPQNRLDSSTFV